jgi:hypothetical protein
VISGAGGDFHKYTPDSLTRSYRPLQENEQAIGFFLFELSHTEMIGEMWGVRDIDSTEVLLAKQTFTRPPP